MSSEETLNEDEQHESIDSDKKVTSKSIISQNLPVSAYNPFTLRLLPQSWFLSDTESFVLLLNVILGTGIMHIPFGFKRDGNAISLITICVATVICIHCNYLWVKCNHELCYRTHVSSLTYDDVIVLTFGRTTTCLYKYSKCVRFIVQGIFFITYFWISAHYMRSARISIENVIFQTMDKQVQSIIITFIIIILIAIMGFMPNLKVLSQFSFISVGLALGSFLAMFIHIIQEKSSDVEESHEEGFSGASQCVTLIVFSLQSVGFLLPMENVMKNPHHLIQGQYGVGINNVTLILVAIIYAVFGFISYEKYGVNMCYDIADSIPKEHWMRNTVHFAIGISLLSSVSTSLFVLYDIAWKNLYNKFLQRPVLASIITRIIIIMTLIICGSFLGRATYTYVENFSGITSGIMGIMMPAILDTVLSWNKSYHIPYLENSSILTIQNVVENTSKSWIFRLWACKNCVIVMFGAFVIISSMYHGIRYFINETLTSAC